MPANVYLVPVADGVGLNEQVVAMSKAYNACNAKQ